MHQLSTSNMIIAIYGILFSLMRGIYSMYIMEVKDITQKYCSFIPANSSLPCREFTIPDPEYCNESKLGSLFPELYFTDDDISANWPGEIRNISVQEQEIRWKVTPDGSVHFLKGFQVIQDGNSMETFGSKLCSVIDLTNMTTKTDYKDLLEVTFSVSNDMAGSYFVVIKPLPLPQIPQVSSAVVLQPDPKFEVYHPDIKVRADYIQINSSAVNISVTILLQKDEVSFKQCYIQITRDGTLVDNVPQIYNISQQYFLVSGLAVGNYTIKIIPIDPFLLIDGKCECYFGTPDNRRCMPCTGYAKTIEVRDLSGTITTRDEDNTVALVVAPTLVITLVVTILLIVWHVGFRHKLLPFMSRRRRYQDSSSVAQSQEPMKVPCIHIVYAWDHTSHKTAVENFVRLISNCTDYKVSLFDISLQKRFADSLLSVGDTTTESDSDSGRTIEESVANNTLADTDVLCFVHSEWAQKLLTLIGSGDVGVAEVTSREDQSFLYCVNEVCQNTEWSSKIISIRFEYTPESALIKEPFLGPVFNIPENTESLVKHLCSKSESHCFENATVHTEDKIALISTINAAFAYQCKHSHWLFSKLFHLRNAPSSDDSGIVITKRLRSRSTRSRSADTIPFPMCKCDVSSRRTLCDACYRKRACRQRTHSCDLSFYLPESIGDVASERLSLLESKFLEINTRYRQALHHKVVMEDDSFTLDGQSI